MPLLTRFRLTCLTVGLLVLSTFAAAQPPAGYYSSAEGLRGQALETALRNIIDGHNSLSYNAAKDRLWSTVDPQNGVLTCIYSGRTSTSLSADSNGMNAEHTWPQSRGAGSTPPRSDLHHLFVTDSGWNSRRGSLRFKRVNNPTATSPIGAKVNSNEGFEPPDEYKGDVARVIFYFAVRYNLDVINGAVLNGTDSSTSDNHMGELDDLVAWHFADPPSQFEFNRNNRIYAIQGNRNPFIDNPNYVTDWLQLGPPAPSIATVTIPAVPDFARATHLSSSITSSVAVNPATVRAYWRLGSTGTFTNVAMELLTGSVVSGTWQTTTAIPVQPGNTRVEYYVEAADTAGTMTRQPASGQSFFVVRAPNPPAINVSNLPSTPAFNTTITWRTAITSELGIATGGARLWWRTGTTGEFTALPLGLTTGTTTSGTWETAAIGPLAGGTVVQYYAEATDTAGTTTRQPASGTSSLTVRAPIPPAITIATVPAAPRYDMTAAWRATITSELGIANGGARVWWRNGAAGEFAELPLALVAGTTTSGTWDTTAVGPLAGNSLVQYYTEATDAAGTTTRQPAAGTASFTVYEPAAPTITATISPAVPRVGDAITISATINSEEGIDPASVMAVYTIGGGQPQRAAMTRTAGSNTAGTWILGTPISGLAEGTVLAYAVEGEDVMDRPGRDPETGLRQVTVTAVPRELDISGYRLRDIAASSTLTFPAGTTIPANGFVIVARQATQSVFEATWGPLPAGVVYINSQPIMGGNGMVINGGESFVLEDATGTRIDGPSNASLNAQNARVSRTATNVNEWVRGTAAQANPGVLELAGTGAGLIITEYSDPTTGFEQAFVEIYYDATTPPPPIPDGELMTVY